MQIKDVPFQEIFTFKEVSKILKVVPETIRNYTKRSEFPLKFYYLNPTAKKGPRVNRKDLLEFIESLEDRRRDV